LALVNHAGPPSGTIPGRVETIPARIVSAVTTASRRQSILALDAGKPLTIMGGVRVGCFEPFGHESIRTIRDLKVKKNRRASSRAVVAGQIVCDWHKANEA
jgi:hypothetical protein